MSGRREPTGTMRITSPATRHRKRRTWDRKSRCWESPVIRHVTLCAVLALARPAAAAGQTTADSLAHRALATRAELDSLARALALAGGDSSGRGETLTYLRTRLAAGDFQAGDRMLLQIPGLQPPPAVQVAGQPAVVSAAALQARVDTFTVGRDRDIVLPVGDGGPISLRGVLRSELQDYLSQQLSQYLKYPAVRARPLLRVSVQGAVAKPGYYFVPSDVTLSDALMAAGGTVRDAKMKNLRVERSGSTVLKGRSVQEVIAAGRTLEDANLQTGDQLFVPGSSDVTEHMRFLWLVVSLAGGIYGLTRVVH